MLEDTQGIHGVTRQDIKTGVSGVNHFTWLTRASYEGTDLFPQYREFAQKYHETGFDRGGDGNWMNSHFASSHRVKFDLFLRYGLIAAAGDRHLAEFVPPWYLESPETAHRWGFTLTPVDWREKDLQNRLQKRAAMLENGLGPELEASGEEGHLLIKALLGLGELVSNVNLLNRGQAAGLPLGAVVETNALFTRDCVSPVMEEPLPVAIGAMVTRAAHNQIATVKAALHCDRQEALRALLNDPQACRLQTAQAQQMLDEMIANTLDILPSGWKKN